jgi:hypothetical protein
MITNATEVRTLSYDLNGNLVSVSGASGARSPMTWKTSGGKAQPPSRGDSQFTLEIP